MNQIIIIGNLAGEPEERAMPNGKTYVKFCVYVHDLTKKDNVQKFYVYAWEKLGTLCKQFLGKGSKVMVQGKAGVDAYVKKDGTAQGNLTISATSVEFLTPPKPDTGEQVKKDDIADIDPIDFPF